MVDLEWIASTARAKDPALPHDVAMTLASEALPLAQAGEDAPSIARELIARYAETQPSGANAVAVATVDSIAPRP